MNDNFKYQMIAIQALDKEYGFCPAPEQVKLLESGGDGYYILFRVGEHEYRCDNGTITNLEYQKKSEETINQYFKMFVDARKEEGIAEDRIKDLQKRINELRFENRELKDANKQLKSERDEFIKCWLSVKETADKLIREMKRGAVK